jgi:hypothetical protein
MPYNNGSFGVFPSQSAVRSKSTGDLQRLYFRTCQRDEHDWRTIPENDRPENFDQIHNIGKRTTKYMKFQKKTAPLVDRTACRYNQEFTPKPLGDYATNKELAITFSGAKKPTTSKAFDAQTNYQSTFKDMDTQQLRSAKQKSCAPKQVRTSTLGGTGDLLETGSMAHQTFRTPPLHLAKNAPALAPKPNLTMAGQQASHLFTTAYNRDFVQHGSSVVEARYEDFMPPSEQLPYLADPSIYNARRACYLSPGA